MLRFVSLCFGTVVRLLRARRSLLIENLALRQQLAAIKRRYPRSQLGRLDELFWIGIRQCWSQWKKATVVRWHQAGFRLYWRLISKVKKPIGRRQTPKQVRQLIFRMVAENTTSGAPRKNHREAIAAMDFFTVPTITFGVLYCFFVIGHDRRRMLHVNVTKHPTSGWIIQQLREAFPFEASHKYLIFDRDQKFGLEVIAAVKATRIIPKRTSFRSPWQNGIPERWVGSCRRVLLDHIVALNERRLKRLLSEYVRYHHEDRTHLGLEKGTPDGRICSVAFGRVLSQLRLGGLHHRYNRAA
jgi:putative transposase